MSDEVNIEVNGVPMKARKGQMVIQVTDANDVYVPRFCYHEKLPIAANCRMCLVEVEKAPKPMPACATPVAEGMKVFTKSPKAIAAQRAVMEFLLINHPLDCPICDQGGECELQDLAMGFGRDISRYSERKRVVKDKNLGPLVSTDMTRCIHCTRCVRFTQDVQGFQELGTVGRGEMTEIGTFIEKSVDHELSANIIDLCPVGALNNKPYRYRARAWEMTQHPLISPHDAVGTNIYAHVLRGRVMRIVPRANEDVNETWIADRDRFSYQGIYSEDRLLKPSIRENGVLQETDWETALQKVAEKLGRIAKQHGGGQIGAVASPNSTLEELFLLSRVARGLGSANLDHRLRRSDFRDEESDPLFPSLGVSIKELETANSVLVIGSNIRKEVPLLAHRIRKAALKGGKVSFINAKRYDYLFPVAGYLASNGIGSLDHLIAVAAAAINASGKTAPASIASLVGQAQPNDTHKAIAQQLSEGERRLILLGAIAQRDPAFADLRLVAGALAEVTGATLGYLPEGGNAVGAHIVGFLPGRSIGGGAMSSPGLNVADMFAAKLKAYIVFGAVEPKLDIAAENVSAALEGAEFVVALSPYSTAAQFADVVLPIGTFAETAGTYVNLEGRWQSVPGAASPVGESRPGWKVLRVLGNLLNLPGFEYTAADQVTADIRKALDESQTFTAKPVTRTLQAKAAGAPVVRDVPIYQVDAMVRRSSALQNTREGREERGVGA
ncbi:NADH-quinone oxidoreductase [Steroidobacter agaridevorans]|uniref:NADH-quinone oxidoreductase n=1 Tax=Steroidobacter agaridevorans TaxID=2695856 RepID=A0A829YNE6_9GAMM|nr:NADH-quinone oxidoreductase subunit NuoG [Steroidobacter agaridevorans]GFE84855.1 NADH-quinone oxidoreductase [Steroidobacter agaridevorans]GFE91864.1 NADH-quinone oxidoreductase [Steroidobacter agaridevorans]